MISCDTAQVREEHGLRDLGSKENPKAHHERAGRAEGLDKQRVDDREKQRADHVDNERADELVREDDREC